MSKSTMPRRNLFKSLAALVAFPGATRADGPDEATPADAPSPPASALFEIPCHGHWGMRFDAGRWTAQLVPRWEVPSIAAKEQPHPAFTELLGITTYAIMRWWKPEDVPSCRLCRTCNADVTRGGTHPGYAVCIRPAPEDITLGDAPLYRDSDCPRD